MVVSELERERVQRLALGWLPLRRSRQNQKSQKTGPG
jgi:hypothetical protein